MQRFALLFVFFLFAISVSAQSTASVSNSVSLELINLDENDSNWSFFADEENKLYYVDFEKLSFNLSDIVVKNSNGEVIIKEDVLDLPVNTIFELDFSEYGAGDYEVELRSFTGMLRKTISIQ